VDPWGTIIAETATEPGVVLARIDPAQVAAARTKIPSLTHGRRFEVIESPLGTAHMRVVRGTA
jgi:predicted amidohydrolase